MPLRRRPRWTVWLQWPVTSHSPCIFAVIFPKADRAWPTLPRAPAWSPAGFPRLATHQATDAEGAKKAEFGHPPPCYKERDKGWNERECEKDTVANEPAFVRAVEQVDGGFGCCRFWR